jgi:DNA-binding transcriptional MerR regulator
MQKITAKDLERIKKLKALGWSLREIGDDIGVSASTIKRYVPGEGVEPQALPQDKPPAPPPEPSEPEPPGEPLTADQLSAWVGEQVRRQRDEASRCAAQQDSVGQQRAAKLMAMFAAMAKRMMPAEDEKEFVRVRVADMEAAAQQTRADLERMLEAGTDPLPFSQTSPAKAWIQRLLLRLS